MTSSRPQMLNDQGDPMQYLVESALYSASQLFMLPVLLAAILLAQFLWALFSAPEYAPAGLTTVGPKEVGIALFGPYLLAVELASMLLLAALVAAFHLGRHEAKE